ncbi:MAG: hypothetical protein ACXAD7_26965, partial [Candidatus Kariarchaeaceae archaeon]
MQSSASDNANDTWDHVPDNDFDVDMIGPDTIEFYYNISLSYPVERIALAYIDFDAWGVDRQTNESELYFNGEFINYIYETNTSASSPGQLYYLIDPTKLTQYNNRIAITVPLGITLRVDNFQIRGISSSVNQTQIQRINTPSLNPREQSNMTFTYNPEINNTDTFDPDLVWLPTNLTHAWVSPGYEADHSYGSFDVGSSYITEPDADIIGFNKLARIGDLPILYDIAPDSLSSSSSTKIVQFPGDLRVDGLTIMSSTIVDDPNIRLAGNIASVSGLGNYTEAANGLGYYADTDIAPDYFYINDTWTTTNLGILDYLNHSSTGLVMQTDIPNSQSPGSLTGTLSLYSGDSVLYSINLQVTITEPTAKILLLDSSQFDTTDTDRNYDKLWDQLYEMWNVGATSGYDIDSLYQEYYLYEHRIHDLGGSVLDFLYDFVCDNTPENNLPYSGIIAIDMDTNPTTTINNHLRDFMERGGNLVQLGGTNSRYIGPSLTSDIAFYSRTNAITSFVEGSDYDNPLLEGVNQLFYLGGGYMLVDQRNIEQQFDYNVISGENWMYDPGETIIQDLAVIYHDAIYPDPYCYDTGKYTSFYQDYLGLKIVVGSASIAHSWFLEQTDYWAYAAMKAAAENGFIDETFSIDLDNRKFIENIISIAGNKAPEITSMTVSPRHVEEGENITVRVTVTDDRVNPSELAVLCPEKLTSGTPYVQMSPSNTSGEYTGSFIIIDSSQVHNWNIYVVDDLNRIGMAVDGYKTHFIPWLNVKPFAWSVSSFSSTVPSTLTTVIKGDLVNLPFFYADVEDGGAIICNVSLVYHINQNETEIVLFEVFSGRGQDIFLIDTSSFKSGTYTIVANVTDTDGGSAEYTLGGFNIGGGTYYKSPKQPSALEQVAPVVGAGATV